MIQELFSSISDSAISKSSTLSLSACNEVFSIITINFASPFSSFNLAEHPGLDDAASKVVARDIGPDHSIVA